MSFLKNQQLFFFLLLLLVVPFPSIAAIIHYPDDSLLVRDCAKNFTNNDLLQSNINSLITDMKAQASLQRFAVSSSGAGYEKIYGLALCQEDISQEECSACISDAAEKIREACPDAAETRAWEEKCFLRYDTEDFIGKLDKSYAKVWYSIPMAENRREFELGVAELMVEVMAAAAGERRRFSSGQNFLGYGGGVTVYGMAQCTQDLNESDCSQCLEYSRKVMTNLCDWHNGCHIFGTSCVLRYETYKFLDDAGGYAPAPAPSMASTELSQAAASLCTILMLFFMKLYLR